MAASASRTAGQASAGGKPAVPNFTTPVGGAPAGPTSWVASAAMGSGATPQSPPAARSYNIISLLTKHDLTQQHYALDLEDGQLVLVNEGDEKSGGVFKSSRLQRVVAIAKALEALVLMQLKPDSEFTKDELDLLKANVEFYRQQLLTRAEQDGPNQEGFFTRVGQGLFEKKRRAVVIFDGGTSPAVALTKEEREFAVIQEALNGAFDGAIKKIDGTATPLFARTLADKLKISSDTLSDIHEALESRFYLYKDPAYRTIAELDNKLSEYKGAESHGEFVSLYQNLLVVAKLARTPNATVQLGATADALAKDIIRILKASGVTQSNPRIAQTIKDAVTDAKAARTPAQAAKAILALKQLDQNSAITALNPDQLRELQAHLEPLTFALQIIKDRKLSASGKRKLNTLGEALNGVGSYASTAYAALTGRPTLSTTIAKKLDELRDQMDVETDDYRIDDLNQMWEDTKRFERAINTPAALKATIAEFANEAGVDPRGNYRDILTNLQGLRRADNITRNKADLAIMGLKSLLDQPIAEGTEGWFAYNNYMIPRVAYLVASNAFSYGIGDLGYSIVFGAADAAPTAGKIAMNIGSFVLRNGLVFLPEIMQGYKRLRGRASSQGGSGRLSGVLQSGGPPSRAARVHRDDAARLFPRDDDDFSDFRDSPLASNMRRRVRSKMD